MICYLIPGLGCSEKIFENLRFPPGITSVPIYWAPYHQSQTLSDYCISLLPQVDFTKQHVLVGVSFGGAVAVELAKLSNPVLTVIVSSVPTAREIPRYFRYAGWLGCNRLPAGLPFMPKAILRYFVGFAFAPLDKRALTVLSKEIANSNPSLVQWSINALMGWKSSELPNRFLHIHGSSDRIFPVRCVAPDVVIKGGGHFMIYTHAKLIGQLIEAEIKAAQG